MRVALIENTAVTHHGQIGVALHERGALVDILRPFRGDALPLDFSGWDAVIVFGGEQSARDDARHPYLPHLADAMRKAVEAGQPVLGICLGSQLMARGFGAENQLGTAPEFGWCRVDLTGDGEADPVLSAAGSAFRVFQWHSDTFTLPAGALHLARSDRAAHQAFRVGRAGYATQFHFEANRAVVADWARRFPDLIEGMEPGWLSRHAALAERDGALADAAGLRLARAFLDLVPR
ncbi:type 1 glutamine amidotransferase [Szabonella alba]|uniref:Type 1 glutamine amidotransferase n=1 Tax=Szabonella alba TaxID=2804194 RepID=A0A8K0VDD5_9RHOB|nr:type 1 glutamine amidotransferase [Szabonella alba]MBL4917639.1 type 1 glutamine amidotransferase [Szabonella alba]